jgi:uncharacterized protein (UPF0179 family)
MANVTLVGEKWAVEGNEFIYLEPSSDCKDCKVKTVCFNLQEGRRYRIKSIRETRHPCKVHDAGVVAVEFEELPVKVAMEANKVMEGVVVTFSTNGCQNTACMHRRLCSQNFIKSDQKVKILTLCGELDCVEGKKLMAVEIEEAT